MPKVTGPLHSDSASGQTGKKLIYQTTGARRTVKRYAVPPNKPTPAQTAIRNFTKTLMQLWPTLSPEEQTTWLPLAARRNIPPIAAFEQENWKRHRAGQDVTYVWPPVETPPPDYTFTITAIAHHLYMNEKHALKVTVTLPEDTAINTIRVCHLTTETDWPNATDYQDFAIPLAANPFTTTPEPATDLYAQLVAFDAADNPHPDETIYTVADTPTF